MLSIRENLIEGLNTATELQTYFLMPPVNVSVSIPLLVLEETQNDDYFYSNTIEIANVSYNISIYATNPMDLFKYMDKVDDYMREVGLKRTSTSGDMYIEPLYCRTMTFTGKIQLKEDGYHIYQ